VSKTEDIEHAKSLFAERVTAGDLLLIKHARGAKALPISRGIGIPMQDATARE
jgi:hypothetical protein